MFSIAYSATLQTCLDVDRRSASMHGRDQARTFWEQSVHALLTAVILHVVYSGADSARTFASAHLLSDPRRPLQETLEALLLTHHDPNLDQGWRDPHTGDATYTHPTAAAAARSLLDMEPRTSSGIVATAQAHLSLFRDPPSSPPTPPRLSVLHSRASRMCYVISWTPVLLTATRRRC
jgi:Type IV secretory system Conjugative DNA transfer